MKISNQSRYKIPTVLIFTFLTILAVVSHAQAVEYKALENVQQLRVVFDVSTGSPQVANNVFWAVRNLYQEKTVTDLPKQAQVIVVFRGRAVKLVSADLSQFSAKDLDLALTFQETIKTMKSEGVVFEICQYAMEKAGVDSTDVLQEIDQVGNGFVSIAGYQMQGYGVITIQ